MRHLVMLALVITLGALASLLVAQEKQPSLCGKLDATGRLSDIGERDPAKGDVPLREIPGGRGPFKYDAATRTAVPLIEDSSRTEVERLATLAPPSPCELEALFVLAASKSTDAQRKRAQELVDARAAAACLKAGW